MSPNRISNIPVATFLFEDFGGKFRLGPHKRRFQEGVIDLGLTYFWDVDLRNCGKEYKEAWLRRLERTAHPIDPAANLPMVRQVDVFEIRRKFYEIEDPMKGVELFTEYGPFDDSCFDRDVTSAELTFADLVRWQELLKLCQTYEPSEWGNLARQFRNLPRANEISKAPEISIVIDSPITLRMYCDGIRGATMAAIFLDKLAKVRSSMCDRPDCGVVFNHESGHKRKYCSPDCAHLEAVRRNRARKAGP